MGRAFQAEEQWEWYMAWNLIWLEYRVRILGALEKVARDQNGM
jgi:hypothetical protein